MFDVTVRVPNRSLAGQAGVVFEMDPIEHDDPTRALSVIVTAGDDGLVFPYHVVSGDWVGGPFYARDGVTPSYEWRIGLLGNVDWLADKYLRILLTITNGPMSFKVLFEDAT